MIDTYKAGDFTSGKMGEIFRNCFNKDHVIINHKQFGNSYLVDEKIIQTMAVSMLHQNSDFLEYQKSCTGWNEDSKYSPYRLFGLLDMESQMHFIEDFYEEEFDSWFEILTIGGRKHEK